MTTEDQVKGIDWMRLGRLLAWFSAGGALFTLLILFRFALGLHGLDEGRPFPATGGGLLVPYDVGRVWVLLQELRAASPGRQELFSGQELALWVWAGMMVSFVLGPGLLAWGMREWARGAHRAKARSQWVRAALFAGGSICVSVVVFAVMNALVLPGESWRQRERSRQLARENVILADLAIAGRKAQVLRILPTDRGGTGGRWVDPSGDAASPITPERLAPAPAEDFGAPLRGLFPAERISLLVEVVRQDSLVIWAIGEGEGRDAGYANRDGRAGRIEARATVTPTSMESRFTN